MIYQACGLDKKILVPKNEDFLAGAGGLGLVATTQSRVFDFGFATLLGIAQPQKLALLIFGNPARGSDSPPDCHSLPLPFESSSNCILPKRKSPRKNRGLYFFGRGGRTRTRDPRFWRPVLYQLSYTPVHPYIISQCFLFCKSFFEIFSLFLILFELFFLNFPSFAYFS